MVESISQYFSLLDLRYFQYNNLVGFICLQNSNRLKRLKVILGTPVSLEFRNPRSTFSPCMNILHSSNKIVSSTLVLQKLSMVQLIQWVKMDGVLWMLVRSYRRRGGTLEPSVVHKVEVLLEIVLSAQQCLLLLAHLQFCIVLLLVARLTQCDRPVSLDLWQ